MPTTSVASSETGSVYTLNAAAASNIAANFEQFNSWARSVSLQCPDGGGLPDTNTLPQVLQDLLEQSKVVPSWLTDKTSVEYNSIRDRFSGVLPYLAASFPAQSAANTDSSLSKDLQNALPSIAGVVAWETSLDYSVPISESERSVALESLMGYVFNIEGKPDFAHKPECTIQMPSFAEPRVEAGRPDSTSYFKLNRDVISGADEQILRGCTSIASQVPPFHYVLHWVTELERQSEEQQSKQQVWMGMVTGLYQRRALGFPGQYVFGTAHHSSNRLSLFAGCWRDQVEGATTNQIIIYPLCNLNATSARDMLQFYSLLRLSRQRAVDYKNEIESLVNVKLPSIRTPHPQIHLWAPPYET